MLKHVIDEWPSDYLKKPCLESISIIGRMCDKGKTTIAIQNKSVTILHTITFIELAGPIDYIHTIGKHLNFSAQWSAKPCFRCGTHNIHFQNEICEDCLKFIIEQEKQRLQILKPRSARRIVCG